MTSLAARTTCAEELAARIRAGGPISVADYMAATASAYYARGDVFGRGGDFITAPEISQVFGELVGLWCAVAWQRLGGPAPFQLVECGPGRGTMMTDLLRAAAKVDGFLAAARINLVERSEALRAHQRAALRDFAVDWRDDLAQVPEGPLLLVANEFLDALPVRQFENTAQGWQERHVTMDADGGFVFANQPTCDPTAQTPRAAGAPVGAVMETSPAIAAFVGELAGRLARTPGAALLIDYGYLGPALGDTLQAVKAHEYYPVLSRPGEADLTAHVDFAAVARAASGAAVHGPVEQGPWLESLGIHARAAQLKAGKPAEAVKSIDGAIQRLVRRDGMGSLFKVMSITSPGFGVPEGFSG